MSTIPDETLMAFADGELNPAEAAVVDAAMRSDPRVAQRVAEHRALRARVSQAYAGELDQPVPDRFAALLLEGHGAPDALARPDAASPEWSRAVTRVQRAREVVPRGSPPRWRLPLSMAAAVLMGVAIGYAILRPADPMIADRGGEWVAAGKLENALADQTAGEGGATSAVQIGLSFKSKAGAYCRLFTSSGDVDGDAGAAGVACRQPGGWTIQALARTAGEPGRSEYRTAGSAVPALILDAVQRDIDGEPLDRDGEAAARRNHWLPTTR